MDALIVKDVSKRYKHGNGIENISFNVKKGHVLALCGGNGAGKSTLLEIIIGQLKADHGTVQFYDEIEKGKKPFTYMPDDLEFPDQLTAKEVIEFLAHLHDIPAKVARKRLEEVGLEKEKGKRIRQYSKGMKQRLAFAQSLLSDAPILILDEPTNGLDPYWVKKWKDRIIEEKERGRTIIFSTHLLPIVEEIADDVLFLYQGEMILSGEVATIRDQENGRTLEEIFFAKIEEIEQASMT